MSSWSFEKQKKSTTSVVKTSIESVGDVQKEIRDAQQSAGLAVWQPWPKYLLAVGIDKGKFLQEVPNRWCNQSSMRPLRFQPGAVRAD